MTINAAEYREIPLSLLDEPDLPMRESMDETTLDELVVDIRNNGLIQPLVVVAHIDRFKVIAGHRRLLACRRVPLNPVPCLVRVVDEQTIERLKSAENIQRDNVNAAEEASYFAELLVRHCGDDTEKLADMLGLKRAYVESRLLLYRGHPDVFDAVKRGAITMAVAHVLNSFPDEVGIRMYLESALTGVTARVVKQWLVDYKNFRANNPTGDAPKPSYPTDVPVAPIVQGPSCVCCLKSDDAPHLVAIYVHDYCHKAILDQLLRAYRGEGVNA